MPPDAAAVHLQSELSAAQARNQVLEALVKRQAEVIKELEDSVPAKRSWELMAAEISNLGSRVSRLGVGVLSVVCESVSARLR